MLTRVYWRVYVLEWVIRFPLTGDEGRVESEVNVPNNLLVIPYRCCMCVCLCVCKHSNVWLQAKVLANVCGGGWCAA